MFRLLRRSLLYWLWALLMVYHVPSNAVSRFLRGSVIQSLSAWKQTAMPHWTAVAAQPDWPPPPEVVDLTLDEDRHRYLL